ncbi:hypothetical protein D9M73_187500 [compost metagenome]
MVAGFVIELLQVFVQGAVIARAGAGDQEHQRCGVILCGNAIVERLDRPEVVWQFERPFRTQGDTAHRLIDVFVQG